MDASSAKLVVLGDGGVGKSALTLRLVRGKYVEYHDPTVEDSYTKTMSADGTSCKVDLIDTAGQEEFRTLREQWYKEGDGFLLVFAIDNSGSFETAKKMYTALQRAREGETLPIVLVGNKVDLQATRAVSSDEGRELAQHLNAPYFEVSAKTGLGASDCFERLLREVLESRTAAAAAMSEAGSRRVSRTSRGSASASGDGKCVIQ